MENDIKDIVAKLQSLKWVKENYNRFFINSEADKLDEYEQILIDKLNKAISLEVEAWKSRRG